MDNDILFVKSFLQIFCATSLAFGAIGHRQRLDMLFSLALQTGINAMALHGKSDAASFIDQGINGLPLFMTNTSDRF
jgi:hypothetical protein